MVTKLVKGIIVTNVEQSGERFRLQVKEFLNKSKLIDNLQLKEVSNPNALMEISKNPEINFCLFWDKDIYLAKEIEIMGIRVFNCAETISICDDKALTAVNLSAKNVDQPRYFVLPLIFYGNIFDYYESYKTPLLELGFPLVIKHRQGSFGDQVFLAKDEAQLKALLKEHGHKQLIAQQFIKDTAGTDYRMNVVGNKVVLTVKRHNDHDFRSNINQGGTASHYQPSELMQELAINAARAVKADFAGVDVMLTDNGVPLVIEVNSNMRTVAVNKVSTTDLTLAILKYIVEQIKTASH